MLTSWIRLPAVTRGCALMLLSTMMFAGMHAAIRHTTQFVPAVEVAFFRNLFGLFVILPLIMRYGVGVFRTNKLNLHMLRAILNVLSMLAFFVGLSMTPIARATALSFTAPLFTALLGVVFLGEVFRWRRWTAIFVGFLGALVILRPGVEGLEFGALLIIALLGALMWPVGLVVSRYANDHRNFSWPPTLVFGGVLGVGVFSLTFLPLAAIVALLSAWFPATTGEIVHVDGGVHAMG